jgi:hypothetical protein
MHDAAVSEASDVTASCCLIVVPAFIVVVSPAGFADLASSCLLRVIIPVVSVFHVPSSVFCLLALIIVVSASRPLVFFAVVGPLPVFLLTIVIVVVSAIIVLIVAIASVIVVV